jgi:hypothetical protein
MDNKNILNLRRDVREVQMQHNRLTTLCAFLLKNIRTLKAELDTLRVNGSQQATRTQQTQQMSNVRSNNTQQSADMNEIHADEILRQLSQSR